jgi:hypothetical protein
MTSFTSEIPQLVDKLTEAAPAGLAHLRESADPVVDRVNEALGRSPRKSRPSWPWVVLGVVGVVAVIVLVTRQRREADSVAEDRTVRLAS